MNEGRDKRGRLKESRFDGRRGCPFARQMQFVWTLNARVRSKIVERETRRDRIRGGLARQ